VEELQRDLTAYQTGFATSAEKATLGKHLVLAIKRHKAIAGGVLATLLVGLTLGTKAIVEGKRAEAGEARATSALADLRKQAPAMRQLAESEAALQHFESALVKLEAAIALDPTFVPAYWRRAWLLMGQEKWSDATNALHVAIAQEPGNVAHASILPLMERFSRTTRDQDRWTPDAAAEVFQYLRRVGAFAEIGRISSKLKLANAERTMLVRKNLEAIYPKEKVIVATDETGRVDVRLDLLGLSLTSLDAVKGLPIDGLNVNSTQISSLEPLRGMQLRSLNLGKTKVADLAPLAGMRLVKLDIGTTQVEDLSPLAGMAITDLNLEFTRVSTIEALRGMPLRNLSLRSLKMADLSPLKGAPIEILNLNECRNVKEVTPLAGMPLKDLWLTKAVDDLSFLQAAPLTSVHIYGSFRDLSALSGKPLRYLEAKSPVLTDLSPLQGAPIRELVIEQCTAIRDFAPLLALSQLEMLRVARIDKSLNSLRTHASLKFIAKGTGLYMPVAQVWAELDALEKKEVP